MVHFECDYNNGCHKAILENLIKTNDILQSGYGNDIFTESAKEKIRLSTECPDADIYFLAGGTQTNAVVISALLRDYEGVVAADTGHVGVHESGAIEYTGHKVLPLPNHDGKIDAGELDEYVKCYYSDGNYEHMVFPGMVYISFPTELGTIYSKSELEAIYSVCRSHSMPLFIDGARLGYGLESSECDLTLPEFASLCDVFYIGGTKVGALCGEAVVFPRNNAPAHFFSTVKQHGALLAKGRLCAVQFDTLFTDGLYFEISKNAIEKADRLRNILKNAGFEFYLETPTNQQFVIADNAYLEKLSEKVVYNYQERYDAQRTVIRFCTSWSTTDSDMDALEQALASV